MLKAPEIPGKETAPETARKQKKLGRALRGTALALLCFALLWYNVIEPAAKEKEPAATAIRTTEARPEASPAEDEPAQTAKTGDAKMEESLPASDTVKETAESEKRWESNAPIGYEVGQQLEDFTAECLDGSTFHLADYRGKIVFLNLWATWCTPCVQELPHFSALHQEKEDVAVLAIHSSLTTDDPAAYLADKGYTIPFTVDSADERLFKIVHGSAALPQTIVLNRSGEVVYNKVGSVTMEALEALYEAADASGKP